VLCLGCGVGGGSQHIINLNNMTMKVFPFGAPGDSYSMPGFRCQGGDCWRGSICLQNISRRECLEKANQPKRKVVEDGGEEKDPFLF